MKFSEELNHYLKILNCTAQDLANKSGLSPTLISRYLNDKRTPRAGSEYFLKIVDGTNPLDKTFIHPDSYDITMKLLDKLSINISDIGKEDIISKLDNINISNMSKELDIDTYTLEDIIKSLKKPSLDPRDDMPQPILKSNILDIKDLKNGMKLQGTIRNVVNFGLFIDIGLHEDGLAHISKLSNEYIKDINDLFSVGEIVDCYVDDIDLDKGKVSLRLLP